MNLTNFGFLLLKTFLKYIVLLHFFSIAVIAQKHNFITYGFEQGLPESQLYTIVEDKLGYLYLGSNSGGLIRFDGENFERFSIGDSLSESTIYFMESSDQNILWVATDKGIIRIENGYVKKYNTENGLSDNGIWSIHTDKEKLWVATEKGVDVIDDDKVQSISDPIFKNNTVFTIEIIDNNNVWFGTNKGLVHYDGTNYKFHISKFFNTSNLVIYLLKADKKNNLWLSTNKGLFVFDGNNVEKINGLSDDDCRHIFIDSYDNCWISTNNGLNKISDNKVEIYNTSNGLSDNSVWSVYEDSNHNIWIATEYNLNKISPENFYLYDKNEKMNGIWAMFESDKYGIMVGVDYGGVSILKDGELHHIFNDENFNKKSVWSFIEDSNKRIWIGADGGAYFIEKNKLHKFPDINIPDNESIMNMLQDEDGNIWFATYWEGVHMYDGKTTTHYTEKNGLSNNQVFALHQDLEGTIWIGTNKGVTYYKDGKFHKFNSDNILSKLSVISIEGDENGAVWFGSYGAGVVRYKTSKTDTIITVLNTKKGLNNDIVLTLSIDKNNFLWVGTNSGINKIDIIPDKTTKEFHIIQWSKENGFAGYETNQNSSMIDKNNHLWVGTIKGILEADIKIHPISYVNKTKLIIDEIKINFEHQKSSSNRTKIFNHDLLLNLDLEYWQNHVLISFKEINLINPNKVKYIHKLEGLETNWSEPNSVKQAIYPSLQPGEYTFLVKSSDNNNWDSEPTKLKIFVSTPFWKTWWFYLLIIFLTITTIYLIFKLRVKTLENFNRRLKENIKAREKYAALLETSERDYRELFEHAHNPILIIDMQSSSIVDANLASAKLYGFSVEELLSKRLLDLVVDQQSAKKCFKKLIDERELREYSTLHKAKTNKEINLEINASIVHYKGKEMIMAILLDVSDRENTVKALESAKHSAEKSDKMKSEFLAQMSHEIRTPINTIMNFNSLIRMEFQDIASEEIHNSFNAIDRGANRLIRTIDLVLNMSDIDSGTYEAHFEETDLIEEILQPIAEEFIQKAKQKSLELYIESYTPNQTTLNIDKYTTMQIFVNLIDNAIKYTNEGIIEASISENDDSIMVDVADTGIGISNEYISSIFNKFSQEEQGYTRRFEGNGLGLALVKKYCDINNAKIEVTSKKGKGTIFTVTFDKNNPNQ